MATITNSIDNLIADQLKTGISANKEEGEQKHVANFIESELDRKIARRRQGIKKGKLTSVNKQTTNDFIDRLSKKILTK